MSIYLGIDIGGTVIKSGLYDEMGHELGVASVSEETIATRPGWAERDMEAMWRAVAATIRQVMATCDVRPDAVAGIGFSAHGKGLYLVDKDGKPVRNGILSSDNRAMPQVRRFKSENIGAASYPLSYQQIWPSHPASILAWLKAEEPDSYARIDRILMAHDWIRFCMTGHLGAEVTNISGSNLLNVGTGDYDSKLFNLFGIDEMLGHTAPVVGSIESPAGMSAEAAELTGLRAGTPVFGGLFDVVSAAVTAGLADDRRINVTMGTWTISTWVTDHILPSDYPYAWGRYCVPGTYFVHEGSPTSASNLEWYVRNYMPAEKHPYDRCNGMVSSLDPASTDLFFLPFLFSSNLGDNLTGGFNGLINAHGPAEMVQAIYEGVGFAQQVHLDRILKLAGTDRQLRLTGGPVRSRVWMQMVSDIAQMPLEIVYVEQSGCMGAAVSAAVGTGAFGSFLDAMDAMSPQSIRVEPDPRVAARYREKYQRFLALAGALNALPAA